MKITTLDNLMDETVSHNPKISKKTIFKSCDLPCPLTFISQATFPPGEIAGSHKHTDMYEYFNIISGNGTIKVNNELFEIKKGLSIFIEPDEFHEICNTGSCNLVILYFGIKQTG